MVKRDKSESFGKVFRKVLIKSNDFSRVSVEFNFVSNTESRSYVTVIHPDR